MRILGIDPGVTGALVLLEMGASNNAASLLVQDIPTVRDGPRGRVEIMDAALADIIERLAPEAAALERVHAMPAQGVSSTFSFGTSYGVIRGVLAALKIPVHRWEPTRWMAAVRLPTRGGKDASRGHAARLFPAYAQTFARARDHGRADAALIALAELRAQLPF